MRTGDQSYIKELNRTIALNILKEHAPISRTQISKRTGLNKTTVSTIVEELIETGLAAEVGRGPSSLGRRPVLLHFNAQAGFGIGIELAVTYVRGILTDLAGSPVKIINQPVGHQYEIRVAIEQIHLIVQQLRDAMPKSPLGLLGVGIGVPGLVNYAKGIVLNAPNLGWKNISLRSLLQTEWDFPVFVDNEANTGALGEKLFGLGQDVSNLVYMSVSAGLGCGIIVAGKLIRGEDGLAGEFGHMTIEAQGAKCSCGNRGCLEVYASEKYLMQKYQQLSGTASDLDEIISLVQEKDDMAIEAVRAVGYYLGVGIANIVNAINPSKVIIGNRLANIGAPLLSAIDSAVHERCFIKPYSAVSVQLSTLGLNACAIGAASMVLNHYFAGPHG